MLREIHRRILANCGSAVSWHVVTKSSRGQVHAGFSLLELLVVLTIIVTVLGLSSLSLQGLSRDRPSALAEMRSVLEAARVTAMARHTDVYVAFATDKIPDPDRRYRSYALFIPDPDQPPSDPSAANLFQRKVVGISEWHTLPDGLLLAFGAEVDGGQGTATILDAPGQFSRPFRYQGLDYSMPFFLFNAYGMLEIPSIFAERFHHVGVVEAAYEQGIATFPGAPDRTHLGWQVSPLGKIPRASCLRIDASTGRSTPILN